MSPLPPNPKLFSEFVYFFVELKYPFSPQKKEWMVCVSPQKQFLIPDDGRSWLIKSTKWEALFVSNMLNKGEGVAQPWIIQENCFSWLPDRVPERTVEDTYSVNSMSNSCCSNTERTTSFSSKMKWRLANRNEIKFKRIWKQIHRISVATLLCKELVLFLLTFSQITWQCTWWGGAVGMSVTKF